MLIHIEAPDFVTDVVVTDCFCSEAAPAFTWTIGKSAAWLVGHCHYKGWRFHIIEDQPPDQTAGHWWRIRGSLNVPTGSLRNLAG